MKQHIHGSILLLTVLSIGFFFSACAGQQPPPDIPDVREVNLNELEKLITERDARAAWEMSDTLLDRGLINAEEHQHYRDEIGGMINDLFQDAVKEESYAKALSYHKTAALTGVTLSNDPGVKELYRRLLSSMVEKDQRIPSYTIARGAVSSGTLETADLSSLKDDALSAGYDTWAQYLGNSPAEAGKPTDIRDDLPGIVDSTVTIWVNRGIKMERGMGYPDRVIGSGFFIDYKGYLLTNYHVIESEVDPEYEGFSRLYIRQGGSSSPKIPAKVVGWDPILDLALLKAEIQPKYVFTPGGDKLSLGEPIYAIGSPGGLEKTITSGIVSAVDRRLLQIGDAMQIDVPINHGNSGGPLLDEKGLLVGVVFAGIEVFEGINFAIPVYWLQKILPQLYAGGEVAHGWIGTALNEDARGLTALYSAPGSPAERCGVKEGDRLLSINGTKVSTLRDAQAVLVNIQPGDLVRTQWKKTDDSVETVFMDLQKRPRSPILDAYKRGAKEELVLPLFGMKIEETGGTLWEKSYVVKKVYPGTIADETGLSVNDPFYWRGLKIDPEKKTAILQMIIKKRKAGFLESSMQIGAYIEVDYFI